MWTMARRWVSVNIYIVQSSYISLFLSFCRSRPDTLLCFFFKLPLCSYFSSLILHGAYVQVCAGALLWALMLSCCDAASVWTKVWGMFPEKSIYVNVCGWKLLFVETTIVNNPTKQLFTFNVPTWCHTSASCFSWKRCTMMGHPSSKS